MKKLKKLIIAGGLLISMSALTLNTKSEAAAFTHKVSNGQNYWSIAKNFGVPLKSLEAVNHWSHVYPGKNIVIPNSPISSADKSLMARLVHAEAGGEPYAGKVAVAAVVLNRMSSSQFPHSVPGVIFQNTDGHYAFQPVQNGRINQPADSDSKKAVNEALALMGKGNGSLYFFNPKTSTSSWIFSRTVLKRIGNHVFAK
ncbi:cell wall hydrolase [Heyndrickxia acidicola]|uniref:Cell wall hydrolase n=1 Tax=Heyndrickxia acidicola TaxID=209389 RepID=A0ABU6MMB3_9BACI|nr:cell wall hydrolase [Heyndrickxia acidicola]MED1205439.1 cell wall hydrolase [Heyndrickxia acidicola]